MPRETNRAIYREGIATGNATFENSARERETWDREHPRACRLVARAGREVLGWAALTPGSGRCVYVARRARGRGIGLALLSALVSASEQEGLWTLQAGIFPENAASIELHKRAGFRILGTRERLGCLDGRWRDVVLMERRSATAGV